MNNSQGTLTEKERLWATLAHVPIVTIVWTSYLVYRWYAGKAVISVITRLNTVHFSSIPMTPFILTILSVPVALAIMHLKKKSSFVRDNAQEALRFNLWLLKSYAVSLVVALCGVVFSIKEILWIASLMAILASLLCFQQSVVGIYTAFTGNIFRYRYPGRKS